jgi:hypothetical protein
MTRAPSLTVGGYIATHCERRASARGRVAHLVLAGMIGAPGVSLCSGQALSEPAGSQLRDCRLCVGVVRQTLRRGGVRAPVRAAGPPGQRQLSAL